MTQEPRVTVIIPTFNRAALVIEAVGSVLRQSYRPFEVIVCDDGSTDDTATRVQSLGGQVRYLRQGHSGRPGATRNLGIAAARGELIAFLDDDDLWDSTKLARQVELIDRESADLVYCDRRLDFGRGRPPRIVASPDPASPERFLDLVLDGHFPSICTLLVKRSLLLEVKGFDQTLVTGEDLDLWLRLSPAARAARVAAPLVQVRRRPGSLSGRNGALTYRNAIRVLERMLAEGSLRDPQRRLCRRNLARLYGRFAALQAGHGNRSGAVRAALSAVRNAPASRSTWAGLAKALVLAQGPRMATSDREASAEWRGS